MGMGVDMDRGGISRAENNDRYATICSLLGVELR